MTLVQSESTCQISGEQILARKKSRSLPTLCPKVPLYQLLKTQKCLNKITEYEHGAKEYIVFSMQLQQQTLT